jgi:flagella basal body P-ring formation protein FlgA
MMHVARLACLAVLCAAVSAAVPHAAVADVAGRAIVRLRAEPAVAGATITIGDLFDGAGAAAATTVLPSPPLGESLLIGARSLEALLAKNGLEWPDAGAAQTVRIVRLARDIRGDEIAKAITTRLSHDTGRSLDIRPLASGLVLHASAASAGAPEAEILSFDNATGRFDATVRVAGAPPLRITGIADEVLSVPVLARPYQRGETIAEADLAWQNLRIASLGRSVITDAKNLVGLAAKRPLRSGQPLQSSDIERPVVVAKGALVTITYEVPGLSLSDQGRALEPGAIGDTISVLNPGSHRTLLATVVSAGRVRLVPGDRSLLNVAATR